MGFRWRMLTVGAMLGLGSVRADLNVVTPDLTLITPDLNVVDVAEARDGEILFKLDLPALPV